MTDSNGRKNSFQITRRPAPVGPILQDEEEFRSSGHWSSPIGDTPGAVYITNPARESLFSHIDWGNHSRDNITEQGGLLLGNVYESPSTHRFFAEVTDTIPGHQAVSTSAHLEMTPETWRLMHERFAECQEDRPDLRIIGWYHTHPNGLEVFMSGTDRRTQELYFNRPYDFAVVLNPHKRVSEAFLGADCISADQHWAEEDSTKPIVCQEPPAKSPDRPLWTVTAAKEEKSTVEALPLSDVVVRHAFMKTRDWIAGTTWGSEPVYLFMSDVEKRASGVRSPTESQDMRVAHLSRAKVRHTRGGDEVRIIGKSPQVELFWLRAEDEDTAWWKLQLARIHNTILVVFYAEGIPDVPGRPPIASDFVLEVVAQQPDHCRFIDRRASRAKRRLFSHRNAKTTKAKPDEVTR